jgi:hypothetical protein
MRRALGDRVALPVGMVLAIGSALSGAYALGLLR